MITAAWTAAPDFIRLSLAAASSLASATRSLVSAFNRAICTCISSSSARISVMASSTLAKSRAVFTDSAVSAANSREVISTKIMFTITGSPRT